MPLFGGLLAKQLTQTAGTGDLTLFAAQAGFRNFSAATYGPVIYKLSDADLMNVEIGIGQLVGSVFVRAVVPIWSTAISETGDYGKINLSIFESHYHTLEAIDIPGHCAANENGVIDFHGAILKNILRSRGQQTIDATWGLDPFMIEVTAETYNIFIDLETDITVTASTTTEVDAIGDMDILFKVDAVGGRVVTLPANFYPTVASATMPTDANSVFRLYAETRDAGANWIYTVS